MPSKALLIIAFMLLEAAANPQAIADISGKLFEDQPSVSSRLT